MHHLVRKATEQREIVQTQEDARVLNLAILAFTSLQHVQILRVQDQQDGQLLTYIRRHDQFNRLVELRWPPACSHSTRTIGAALLASRSPCTRFSSPMLSPQSVLSLANAAPTSFTELVERLTCLELHFDDGTDLDNRMRDLSPLSRVVFNAARNMQAVHVGFPSHRPLSLRLEELFHDVQWEKLVAFGIQAWRLDADEIIALVRRHRDRLRGLRLRDVLLKDGSRWRDVLLCLRNEMPRLDWVSLRRIDYASHFDNQWTLGAEIPDDPPGGGSDSDDDSDWGQHPDDDSAPDDDAHDDADSAASHDSASQAATEGEPEQGGAMDFPPLSPAALGPGLCACIDGPDGADAPGDDGQLVTYVQRKLWEKWIVRRPCLEHSQVRR